MVLLDEGFCATSSPSNTISSTAGASGEMAALPTEWKLDGVVLASSNSKSPSSSGTYTRERMETCNNKFYSIIRYLDGTSVSGPVAGTISGTAYTYRNPRSESIIISGNSASGSWTSSNDGIATDDLV